MLSVNTVLLEAGTYGSYKFLLEGFVFVAYCVLLEAGNSVWNIALQVDVISKELLAGIPHVTKAVDWNTRVVITQTLPSLPW